MNFFAGVKHGSLKCSYLQGKDKVLLTDGLSVSVRKDLNGILLLDSALQSSVSKTEDVVRIELPLPEVKLFWLMKHFVYNNYVFL